MSVSVRLLLYRMSMRHESLLEGNVLDIQGSKSVQERGAAGNDELSPGVGG